MSIASGLQELDAPADVTEWASSISTFDVAWESCPSPRHRLWLAAVVGIPVETIAEAAAAGFFAVAEHEPSLEAFVAWVEEAVSAADAETCAALAERCESEAVAGAPYRDAPRRHAFARAAGDVCRAFEGLRSAESSTEAERMNRARATAAYLGGGPLSFVPAAPGPISVLTVAPASVERGLLLLAVASAAEAAHALTTLAGAGVTSVDDAVWDVFATTD